MRQPRSPTSWRRESVINVPIVTLPAGPEASGERGRAGAEESSHPFGYPAAARRNRAGNAPPARPSPRKRKEEGETGNDRPLPAGRFARARIPPGGRAVYPEPSGDPPREVSRAQEICQSHPAPVTLPVVELLELIAVQGGFGDAEIRDLLGLSDRTRVRRTLCTLWHTRRAGLLDPTVPRRTHEPPPEMPAYRQRPRLARRSKSKRRSSSINDRQPPALPGMQGVGPAVARAGAGALASSPEPCGFQRSQGPQASRRGNAVGYDYQGRSSVRKRSYRQFEERQFAAGQVSLQTLPPRDIAYNKMRAWQGAIGVSDLRGIISPAYVVMRLREKATCRAISITSTARPHFAKEAERWSYGITSDMWSLRPEHFKMIYTPQPPPSEQAAMVRFLD